MEWIQGSGQSRRVFGNKCFGNDPRTTWSFVKSRGISSLERIEKRTVLSMVTEFAGTRIPVDQRQIVAIIMACFALFSAGSTLRRKSDARFFSKRENQIKTMNINTNRDQNYTETTKNSREISRSTRDNH